MTQVTLIKFCDTAPMQIADPVTLHPVAVSPEKNPGGGWLIKLDNPLYISNCIKNHDYYLVDPPEYTGARVMNQCTGVERKRFDYKALQPEEIELGRKMDMGEIYVLRSANKKAEPEEPTEPAPEPVEKPKHTWSRKPKAKE